MSDATAELLEALKNGEVSFITAAEMAALLRLSPMTIYRMIGSGELEAVRVGRSFRIPVAAALRVLSAGAEPAGEPDAQASAEQRRYAQALGKRLRSLRREHRLTQPVLAARCGLNPRTVWQAESGRALPSTATIAKLAAALGAEAAALTGTGPPEQGPD